MTLSPYFRKIWPNIDITLYNSSFPQTAQSRSLVHHFIFRLLEILFTSQNSDEIVFYHTSLFWWNCVLSHVLIQMKLCFITHPYLNLLFLMLKLSADFPSPLYSGIQLKLRTVYFVLFYEKRTSLIFLVKLSFPTFSVLNVMYNSKIPGTKHSHLWNAAQLA